MKLKGEMRYEFHNKEDVFNRTNTNGTLFWVTLKTNCSSRAGRH